VLPASGSFEAFSAPRSVPHQAQIRRMASSSDEAQDLSNSYFASEGMVPPKTVCDRRAQTHATSQNEGDMVQLDHLRA